jgi:hypothetical protein
MSRERVTRRLTAADFAALQPFLRVSDDLAAGLRAVLVDGHSVTDVSAGLGCSRQTLYQTLHRVLTTWDHLLSAHRLLLSAAYDSAWSRIHLPGKPPSRHPPGDWQHELIVAPPDELDAIRARLRELADRDLPNKKAGQ